MARPGSMRGEDVGAYPRESNATHTVILTNGKNPRAKRFRRSRIMDILGGAAPPAPFTGAPRLPS